MPMGGGLRDLLLLLGDEAGDVDLLPEPRLEEGERIVEVVRADVLGGQLLVFLGEVVQDLEVLVGVDLLPVRPGAVLLAGLALEVEPCVVGAGRGGFLSASR